MNEIKHDATVSKETAIQACRDAIDTLIISPSDKLQGFHICVNPTVAQIDIYWHNPMRQRKSKRR